MEQQTRPTTERLIVWSKSAKQFTAKIGYEVRGHVGAVRRVRSRQWLGRHEQSAIVEAEKLRERWRRIKSQWSEYRSKLERLVPTADWSRPVWTSCGHLEALLREAHDGRERLCGEAASFLRRCDQEDLTKIAQRNPDLLRSVVSPVLWDRTPSALPASSASPCEDLTVRQAKDRFLEHKRSQIGLRAGRGIEATTYNGIKTMLTVAVGLSTAKHRPRELSRTPVPLDLRLSGLTHDHVERFVHFWMSPSSGVRPRTAINYCKHFRALMKYSAKKRLGIDPALLDDTEELFEFSKPASDIQSFDPVLVRSILSACRGRCERTKTYYVYFPDQLLPIASPVHLRHYLGLIGTPPGEFKHMDVVGLNRTLLSKLRGLGGFTDWHTKEIERFLYHWADPRDQRRIVKIAPGEDAKFWPECFEGGYIRVGWGEAGDLRKFESKDDYRTSFSKAYGATYNGNESTISKKVNEVWTLRELEPGDLVVANKGTSKVLAVGEVVEPGYEWGAHDGDDFNNVLHVNWDTSYEQTIPQQKSWAMVTVAKVPQTLAAQILAQKASVGAGGGSGPKPPPAPVDPLFREIADALERKRQAILYGPPGTGKTYSSGRFAVWWLLRQMGEDASDVIASDEAFDRAEERLSTAQVVRRVWWIVANPAVWAWDQLFKDGRVSYRYGRLQRNYPLVQKGDLVVGYQSTPDKKLVALAKISRELYDSPDGEQRIDLEPLAKIGDGPTYDELLADPILARSTNSFRPGNCRPPATTSPPDARSTPVTYRTSACGSARRAWHSTECRSFLTAAPRSLFDATRPGRRSGNHSPPSHQAI